MEKFNNTPQLKANGLTVLELFCGGGIGALGFKAAGFNIVKAIDFDKNAVIAYQYNFGDYVEQADINSVDIDNLPNTDVIFGGPPCQDYSTAGNKAGAEGDRGKLVFRYLEIIEKKQPKAFIFENVKGLIFMKKQRATFDSILVKFDAMGYEINWKLINAWDYGVGQKRERVFIVGIRKDINKKFSFPTPSKDDYQIKVLRDVIGDLPNQVNHYYIHPFSNRQGIFSIDEPAPTIRTVNRPLPPKYKVHKNDSCGTSESFCIPRRFTVRESLRIQSAPDSYEMPEGIALGNQYKIIGNGIPSRVAWYIGRALSEQLNEI